MLTIESPLTQTIMGTLFTWGMTALGALGCLLHYSRIESRKLLDASLGFSAGVMLAASYWSLLSPAEEMAINDGYGNFSFVPLAVGLFMGSLFVFLADKYAPVSSFSNFTNATSQQHSSLSNIDDDNQKHENGFVNSDSLSEVRKRQTLPAPAPAPAPGLASTDCNKENNDDQLNIIVENRMGNVSHRLLLMMMAITIHNIPEGLAVGVAFGAAGQSKAATLSKARNLALGIGIQNFPEGLAVSLPLKAAGMSLGRSVWYGQLSGLVEPLSGIFGCLAVQMISPILPYALSFAAGAMIYVVFDDIIPEAQHMGNGHLASIFAVVGFVIMMCLDMGLS